LSFKNYINEIKTAGTKLNIISYDPDWIKYEMNVYYDLGYDPVTLKQSIINALNAYRNNLPFNGTVYKKRLTEAVLDVKGVITVNVIMLQSRAYNEEYAEMGIKNEMAAGYFNFASETGTAPDISVLTLTPIDQLA
jgi:hypothetical protein